MAGKRIESELVIRATDQYSATLKRLGSTTGKFSDKVRADMARLQNMRGPLKLIEDFKRQREVVQRSGEALVKARERQRKLLAQIKATKNPTAAMRREFDAARRSVDKLEARHDQQRRTLAGLHGQLRKAGVNTADLAGEQRRLASAVDTANRGMDRQVSRLERVARMQERIADARARMDRSMATASNMTVAGYGMYAFGRRVVGGVSDVAERSGDLEANFKEFQNVTGATDARIVQLRGELEGLRGDTESSISELLGGLTVMVGKGMDFEQALAALPAAARAAKATGTPLDQMAQSAFSVADNLRVIPEGLGKVFDVMDQAGKSGGFELTAMSRKFPEVTAGARALKMEGVDAVAALSAALQIAMKAAGSEDQAATNLTNFLGKITAPDTVRKFKAAGIDLQAELNDALARGVDPMEHLLTLIADATDGDAFAMGELFADKQVLDFLRAMIPNMEEYRRIKAEALGAEGVVDKDLAKAMEGFLAQKGQFKEAVANLFTLPPEVLDDFAELYRRADALVERMNDWKNENPKLVKGLVIAASAVGALALAGGGLLITAGGIIGTLAMMRFGLAVLGARSGFAASSLLGLGRAVPSFGPASAAVRGFSGVVASEMSASESAVAAATHAMNRDLARVRWKGILAAVQMVDFARHMLPTGTPEEVAAKQAETRGRLDDRLRGLPIIGPLMSGQERLQARLGFAPPPGPVRPDGLTSAQLEAARVLESAQAGGLPSPAALDHMRSVAAEMRADIADMKADMDAMGGGTFGQKLALDGKEKELADVEAQLSAAEEQANKVTDALRILSNTSVAPEISTESIDRALERARLLNNQVQQLSETSRFSGPAAAATGAGSGSGGAAFRVPGYATGGQYRPGWNVFGERGPELRYESRSGFIAHHGQLKRMAQMAATAGRAGLAAAVALPAAAGAPAGLGNVTVHLNGGIHVTAPAGVSDPEGLVDAVERVLGARLAATIQASFSD